MTTTDTTAARPATLPLPVLMAAPLSGARAELADLRHQLALSIASAQADRRRQASLPDLLRLRDACDALTGMPPRVARVIVFPAPLAAAKRTPPMPAVA
jgi:hypothetical protein